VASTVRADVIAPPISEDIPTISSAAEPAANMTPAGSPQVQNLLMHALSSIGVKYQIGGSRLDQGFDCSGFVRHVFGEALARELPRSAVEMSKVGNPVELNQLLPGDLLFYDTLKRRYSHVAIYLGEGRFVHAPSRGKSVEIVSMSDAYWIRRFNGARRLIDPE
jgi:cell wall-associated NlpC family hydrolase